MRDYIVTRRVITSRIGNVHQADAHRSPALALAQKVNRITFTGSNEIYKNYTPGRYDSQACISLNSIKRFVTDHTAALRGLQCDYLISRSHCNVQCYLPAFLGGDL